MLVIGLTGGIGSGKSAVAEQFRHLGIVVIDADRIARQVVEPGTSSLATIAEHFGQKILLPDGTLDRRQLRQIVFENPEERVWLERLTHPLIEKEIADQLSSASGPYVVLESPLLFETGQANRVDRTLVVDLPEQMQIIRARSRDESTDAQIQAIINTQISRPDRLRRADDCIDNSGTRESLASQVCELHEKYLCMAGYNGGHYPS